MSEQRPAPVTDSTQPAIPRRAAVVIASTRAAGGVYPDRTGPIIAEWLSGKGFDVSGPSVVPDGDAVGAALRAAVGSVDVVITSGGTGISPTDVTPRQTAAVLDYEIPGLAEALRRRGVDAGVPTAVLSRGLVGVAGRCLVVNLPGSTGGVKDGIAVLDGVLDHALDQLRGGDHTHASRDQSKGLPSGEASVRSTPQTSSVAISGVTEDAIDMEALAAAVADPGAGAVVTFAGVVRDHDDGRDVADLEYHAHPSADGVVGEVAAEVAERHAVYAMAVQHRVGLLTVGDIALGVVVASAHRREAFDACAELVEQVKQRLPVWKRQVFADGNDEWVGSA